MYKLSRYTIYKKYADKVVLFNTVSTAMLELDNNYTKKLEDLLTQNIVDEELEANLLKGNFIVDKNLSEIDLLKYIHNEKKFDNKTLYLTIAPTLTCNFKCHYCFEEGYRKHTMNDEVKDGVISFIEGHLQNGIKNLDITWYGGEPLLQLNAIEELTGRIKKLLAQYNVNYKASMISNGYLLNREVALKLKELEIRIAQITLDGPEEIHDQRRILVNDKGSYRQIINNIKEIHDLISVVIRMNIDKTNEHTVEDVLKELVEYKLQDKIKIYPAKVDAVNNSDLSSSCIETPEFSEFKMEFYKKTIDYGFNVFNLPTPRLNACGAVMKESYVIDPKGDIYKCYNTIGRDEYKIGNVVTKTGKMTQQFLDFMNYDPFNEKCSGCEILPICMGGCPYYKVKYDKNNCLDSKYNIDQTMELYYKLYQKYKRA